MLDEALAVAGGIDVLHADAAVMSPFCAADEASVPVGGIGAGGGGEGARLAGDGAPLGRGWGAGLWRERAPVSGERAPLAGDGAPV